MCTQRASISAVCGYSSLSIMFLLTESAISASDSGSAQVWQNVARFWRALPSSITSSDTSWNTSLGSVSSRGNRYFGTGRFRSCPANTQSSICSRTVSRSCNGMVAISFFGRTRWLPAGLVAATHPASTWTGADGLDPMLAPAARISITRYGGFSGNPAWFAAPARPGSGSKLTVAV